MSITATVRKYTGDSEPFIKLIHSHCRSIHSKYRLNVSIDDYEARKLIKTWARGIENENHPAADLKILFEDVVGKLIEQLIEHGQIFKLDTQGSIQTSNKRRSMAAYVKTHFYEYLSVQTGLSIVQEMLSPVLVISNPDKILDAAVIIHTIPERASCFANLLGLSPLIDAISADI